MMEEITQYKCDYCNTVYYSKEQCIECEKRHIKPKEIVEWTFTSKAQFPKIIEIKFEDGRVFEYKRVEKEYYG
jgi:primosomal protein N'